jgi:hypothetical protein
MKDTPLAAETQAMIRRVLQQSWSERTSVCFNPSIAPLSYGQCAPTSIVVFERFGGEILKTGVQRCDGASIRHFYNRIAGQRHDFTFDQFNIPDYWRKVIYEDIPSSVEEAISETLSGQLSSMRTAFAAAWQQQNASNNGYQFNPPE